MMDGFTKITTGLDQEIDNLGSSGSEVLHTSSVRTSVQREKLPDNLRSRCAQARAGALRNIVTPDVILRDGHFILIRLRATNQMLASLPVDHLKKQKDLAIGT